MGASSDEREARELAEKHGTFIREARHGKLYKFANGGLVCLPTGSPSDGARVWKNARGDVRRHLRAAGVALEDDAGNEEGVMAEPLSTHVAVKQAAQTQGGLHIERRKKVVEITTAEATVDAAHLAAAIGLSEAGLGELTVRDVDGTVLEGPFTFTVETQDERHERL